MILTIDITALLEMTNADYDDGLSSIKKGHAGATGEGFAIGEGDEEDEMSGADIGSPNQSPNPKAANDPLAALLAKQASDLAK